MSGAAQKLTEGVLESLGGLSTLDAAAREMASAPLSSVPDDLLQDMRRALSVLGTEAWRALAALDYVLVERARKRPHPAGRPDLGGGHLRRVGALARTLGTTRRMMMLNRDAYCLTLLSVTMEDERVVSIGDILTRPDFYYSALRWTRPAEPLTAWAHAVARGEAVSPSGPPRPTLHLVDTAPPEHGDRCAGCAAAAHIRRTLETFRTTILPDVPAEIWKARLYLDWLDDLNDSLRDLEGHTASRLPAGG